MRYPSVPDSLVEVMARMKFEAAAQQFMEGTILFVQKLRPKSHWGFYGFPNCYNEKNAELCSNLTLKWNDHISWMFESSSALFPSIYLNDERKINHMSFVKYRLLEGLRHSRKSDGQIIPVYPYVRITYAVSEIYLNLVSLKDIYIPICITGLQWLYQAIGFNRRLMQQMVLWRLDQCTTLLARRCYINSRQVKEQTWGTKMRKCSVDNQNFELYTKTFLSKEIMWWLGQVLT